MLFEIVLIGLILSSPILAVIFIIKQRRGLALLFYFLSFFFFAAGFIIPKLSHRPVLSAKLELMRDIHEPYEVLSHHLLDLSRNKEYDQLNTALEMMSENHRSLSLTIYDPNSFNSKVNEIIDNTSTNMGIKLTR